MTGNARIGPHNEALCGLLADALGMPNLRIERAALMGGGAVQENWMLEVTSGSERRERLVLRTDAPATIAASMSRLEEFQVLRAVHAAGVSVPRPIVAVDASGPLGRAFSVIAHAPGIASAPKIVRSIDDGNPLATALGRELARIHRIVPPWPGLEFLPEPERPVALSRVQRYRHFLDALGAPQPVLEWALRWLERRADDDVTVTLCHGDFRTGNYLVDGGALSAILDWEFAGWGHPYEDIGWFCARCWRFSRPDREAGGIADREAFYAGYEAEGDGAIDRNAIGYWEVMATVRWAVIALQQGRRHMSGEQRSLELALTARLVPELEYDLLDQIEELERRGSR